MRKAIRSEKRIMAPAGEPHPFAWLAAWRDRAALTQEDVAGTLNVTHVTIHRWEAGKSPLTVTNYLRLAQIYGVSSPAQLMFPPLMADQAVALEEAHRILTALPDDQRRLWLELGRRLAPPDATDAAA